MHFVNRDNMPEIAQNIIVDLRGDFSAVIAENIGRGDACVANAGDVVCRGTARRAPTGNAKNICRGRPVCLPE